MNKHKHTIITKAIYREASQFAAGVIRYCECGKVETLLGDKYFVLSEIMRLSGGTWVPKRYKLKKK